MDHALYQVTFKDENGTYQVEIEGGKRLDDAREKLLWKLRSEASNYTHVREVYAFKVGDQWVSEPQTKDHRFK